MFLVTVQSRRKAFNWFDWNICCFSMVNCTDTTECREAGLGATLIHIPAISNQRSVNSFNHVAFNVTFSKKKNTKCFLEMAICEPPNH